jgi:hypothetical protein
VAAVNFWRSAIVESELPPYVRLVGLVVGLHANELGAWECVQSRTLADETGLSVEKVDDALAILIEHGYIDGGGRDLVLAA